MFIFWFFLVVCSSSSLYFYIYDKETLLHCVFVHFGGRAMKGGVCLFELILNINSVSQKSLTAPLSHGRSDVQIVINFFNETF